MAKSKKSRLEQLAKTHKELLQITSDVVAKMKLRDDGTVVVTKEMRDAWEDATRRMKAIRAEVRSLGGSTPFYDGLDAFEEAVPNYWKIAISV